MLQSDTIDRLIQFLAARNRKEDHALYALLLELSIADKINAHTTMLDLLEVLYTDETPRLFESARRTLCVFLDQYVHPDPIPLPVPEPEPQDCTYFRDMIDRAFTTRGEYPTGDLRVPGQPMESEEEHVVPSNPVVWEVEDHTVPEKK